MCISKEWSEEEGGRKSDNDDDDDNDEIVHVRRPAIESLNK